MLISKSTPKDKHSVVIMDQANWHQRDLADEFDNLTIIHFPPYSPELNPIEQVWRWIRESELANRCFDNYNVIVEQCCRAWDRFCSDTSRVISLYYRDWTNLGA